MPIVSLADTDLFYETAGSGAPLVLIPGFASGAWSWAWQVDDLARDFTVVTFDPRGISGSKLRTEAEVSLVSIADDLAELLDLLDISKANLVGISFGGFVAQEFALKYGGRCRRMVLASTGFGGPEHVMPSDEVLAMFSSAPAEDPSTRIRKHLEMSFTPQFAAENRAVVDRFCSLRDENPVSSEVYSQQLRSAFQFDSSTRVGAISAKTLVVSGDSDLIVPTRNSINLAAAIPNAELRLIAGGGHMAFVENATEFNGIVRDFLL